MKILFVCNTLYQIIGACCIRKMFPEAEAELILSDHSTANKEICNQFNNSKLIFDKVCFVKTKYLYEHDAKMNLNQVYNQYRDINLTQKMVKLENKYDKFFCANSEPFTIRIANYVKTTNKNAEINWFEDGLSAYFFDKCYFPNFIGRVYNKLLFCVKKVYMLTSIVDNYYVFKPEDMEWTPRANIKKIKPISDELAKELGIIFDVEHCKDKYNEKYIFFEDGAQDWDKASDVELVNKIAEKVGKENILVRIHPRNPVNRFKELGYKTNSDTSIPWEILVTNIDVKNKVLMTMYSQCVVTPEILLGMKSKCILLANLDSKFNETNHDVYDFMKRTYFDKDKECYHVPKDMHEFEKFIYNL